MITTALDDVIVTPFIQVDSPSAKKKKNYEKFCCVLMLTKNGGDQNTTKQYIVHLAGLQTATASTAYLLLHFYKVHQTRVCTCKVKI